MRPGTIELNRQNAASNVQERGKKQSKTGKIGRALPRQGCTAADAISVSED